MKGDGGSPHQSDVAKTLSPLLQGRGGRIITARPIGEVTLSLPALARPSAEAARAPLPRTGAAKMATLHAACATGEMPVSVALAKSLSFFVICINAILMGVRTNKEQGSHELKTK